MRTEEMQEMHDEIWRQIFNRQKLPFQLEEANTSHANDADNSLSSSQDVETELDFTVITNRKAS